MIRIIIQRMHFSSVRPPLSMRHIFFSCVLLFCLYSLVGIASAGEPKQTDPPPQPQPSDQKAPPAEPTKKPEAAPAPKADEGFDIVLLMDSSGSMKKTDPKDYRKEAANFLSQ